MGILDQIKCVIKTDFVLWDFSIVTKKFKTVYVACMYFYCTVLLEVIFLNEFTKEAVILQLAGYMSIFSVDLTFSTCDVDSGRDGRIGKPLGLSHI